MIGVAIGGSRNGQMLETLEDISSGCTTHVSGTETYILQVINIPGMEGALNLWVIEQHSTPWAINELVKSYIMVHRK